MRTFLAALLLFCAHPLIACGPEALTVANDSSARYFYLSDTITAEPVAWAANAFNDSAWAPAVPWTVLGPFVDLGQPWATRDALGSSVGGDVLLLRQNFSLPADAFGLSGTVELLVDDSATLWLNGTLVHADAAAYIDVEQVRSFPLAGLQAGSNTLAVRVYSPVPPGMGVNYRLKIRYQRPCPDLDSSPATRSYAFPSPSSGPRIQFAFTMPQAGTAELKVYSLSGRALSRVSAPFGAGQQVLDLDIRGYAPGTYAYRLYLGTGALPWGSFIVTKP